MANFCTNCGAELRKGDKFCSNCGTKIANGNNFCVNCGTELRKGDKFCINCGTKIDKTDMKQNSHSFESVPDSIEKENAKKELKRVVGGRLFFNKAFGNKLYNNGLDILIAGKSIRQQVEKEIESGKIKSGNVESRVNELIHEHKIENDRQKAIKAKEKQEEMKKIKMINELFESEEIKSEIRKNGVGEFNVILIRDRLKNKIIKNRENMSEEQIKYYLKNQFKKYGIPKQRATESRTVENNGGYCSYNCIHYCEEFLGSEGEIVGDFTSDGVVDHYCNLGHCKAYGSFCHDYRDTRAN